MEKPNFEKEALAAEFKKYVEDLRLDPNKMKSQKIADVGCGHDAQFVRASLENGITNIAGIDVEFDEGLKVDQEFQGRLIQKGAEEVKLHDMDLITAYASLGSHPDIDLPKTLNNLGEGLKPGGEMKIYPISDSDELKGIQRRRDEILEALKSLTKDEFEYEFIKGEEKEMQSGEKYTDDLLVIRKK
ncbi:hypothetical protein GF391_00740 [Candidatus Uhrbacteria bacterium]|nr:hypothetical protein [Candidatus Uhrbacteria bacterium]